MTNLQIVGIDCSARPRFLGVALAEGRSLTRVECGLEEPGRAISSWVDWDRPVIVAIDAPLGWPVPMSTELASHRAGESIDVQRSKFFRRETDRAVQTRLGLSPLSVGADRIASTAHRALELISDLRARSSLPLPLLWDSGGIQHGIIEVYPAATLRAFGLSHKGYKANTAASQSLRSDLVRELGQLLDLGVYEADLVQNHDKLDAVVCVLAALDYLDGAAVDPLTSSDIIRREGWIWVRDAICSA